MPKARAPLYAGWATCSSRSETFASWTASTVASSLISSRGAHRSVSDLRLGAGFPRRRVQFGVRVRRRWRCLLGVAAPAGVERCSFAVVSGDPGVDLAEDVLFGAQSVAQSGDAVAYLADRLVVEDAGAVVARGRGPVELGGAFDDRPVPLRGCRVLGRRHRRACCRDLLCGTAGSVRSRSRAARDARTAWICRSWRSTSATRSSTAVTAESVPLTRANSPRARASSCRSSVNRVQARLAGRVQFGVAVAGIRRRRRRRTLPLRRGGGQPGNRRFGLLVAGPCR